MITILDYDWFPFRNHQIISLNTEYVFFFLFYQGLSWELKDKYLSSNDNFFKISNINYLLSSGLFKYSHTFRIQALG